MENNNNYSKIIGEIVSDFKFSHYTCGEKFFLVYVSVGRLSGAKDIIRVMTSERLIDVKKNLIGSIVDIVGQIRVYRARGGERSHLMVSVFAMDIRFVNDSCDFANNNLTILDGYICKNPVYRKTPLGREVSDIILAVNRRYGKSDYIPCICWWRNARFANTLNVGTRIRVQGRVQSREYVKKLSDMESETRTAYEVSISKLEVIYSGKEN